MNIRIGLQNTVCFRLENNSAGEIINNRNAHYFGDLLTTRLLQYYISLELKRRCHWAKWKSQVIVYNLYFVNNYKKSLYCKKNTVRNAEEFVQTFQLVWFVRVFAFHVFQLLSPTVHRVVYYLPDSSRQLRNHLCQSKSIQKGENADSDFKEFFERFHLELHFGTWHSYSAILCEMVYISNHFVTLLIGHHFFLALSWDSQPTALSFSILHHPRPKRTKDRQNCILSFFLKIFSTAFFFHTILPSHILTFVAVRFIWRVKRFVAFLIRLRGRLFVGEVLFRREVTIVQLVPLGSKLMSKPSILRRTRFAVNEDNQIETDSCCVFRLHPY